MMKILRLVAAPAGTLLVALVLSGCGGEPEDSNLPTRRARMRDIKLSTDRIMAVLQNRSVDGVSKDAMAIRDGLGETIDLYPEDHKVKYINYNNEAQSSASALATFADAGDARGSAKEFRNLVPTCGKCHEDCAYMLAPAFPEYVD